MGLLKVGVPQNWDKSKKNLRYIRKAGVRQFISTYNRVKDFKGDELLWGDEIEYGIFKLDHQNKKVRLCLQGKEIMDELNRKEQENHQMTEGCNFVPEYGAWMVEATPKRPYTGYTNDLLRVERNMRLRRKRMLTVLGDDVIAPTVSTFPLLGAMKDDGTVPPSKVGGPVTQSDYISDAIINQHPRFGTLTANIRQRRGEKVNIRVPLFRDENTPEFMGLKLPAGGVDGCCGSDSQQLWRYGKGDYSQEKYGKDYVVVGCSTSSTDEAVFKDGMREDDMPTLQKWLVDVQCEGCKGLFYRSSPGQIIPDADWPRNGDIVVGSEISNVPGWIRLQNGYYLPMKSDDGKIQFLHRVSTRATPSNPEMKRIGSSTPLFRTNGDNIAALLEGYKETATLVAQAPAVESEQTKENVRAAIHMDAMAFGMGCCCLQITFQCKDVDESRFLFDQLAVLAPVMMALTASTPLLRGRIADTDARWGIISESVDDRTLSERGRNDPNGPQEELAGKGKNRIYKSRYDCVSTYIYQGAVFPGNETIPRGGLANRVLNMYNDIPVPIDEESYKLLREAGIDPALSQHVAHLFIRDPLVVFDGAVEEVDDEVQTEHWESIQSTNWQSVRWKPPPPRNSPNDPHIGWRTEFRSMEIQLTDFENAAFTAFTVLLTRVILTFDLNLYIPLSRVDANMQRAHSRNASAKGKFFFRRHLAPLEEGDDGYGVKYTSMFSRAVNGETNGESVQKANGDEVDEEGVSRQRREAPFAPGSDEENSYEEMTMTEIMTGKGDYFPGLIPLVNAYLDHIHCDKITRARVDLYLDFIEKRATGELVTPATWMRNFVRTHPDYKGDSVVSDEIAYDLLQTCTDIGLGKLHVPELLGNIKIDLVTAEGAYEVKLESKRAQNDHVLGLLARYKRRDSFARGRQS
eukprot:CAMPEP_0202455790 /NCGR_PEP_ID=MMETSP1360-20130828/13230_1 /ASSEMBLY_ACC=CAM_ASM_000848 /TAXON_ID=515479 /ORGANISM="Licmophora paradoxa, Strain CCMP2313" /LENGTH=914 /DNA_ID=CAMNT_0049075451 /DNA_START=114 /DNA_END=2858 /DNA_ORIENTATION=+